LGLEVGGKSVGRARTKGGAAVIDEWRVDVFDGEGCAIVGKAGGDDPVCAVEVGQIAGGCAALIDLFQFEFGHS